MAKYLCQCVIADLVFNADTAPHALASAQAIATALQRTVVLEQCGDATTRQVVAASAADTDFGHVGLGITVA